MLIMQNMERVVNSREVYTPSLHFARLILYNLFSIKMMFYELGDYCSSLVFCTIKMVVSRPQTVLTVVKRHVM